MTSAELADKIGLSRTAISQIERKKSAPSIEALCKLAKALDCTPDYLLGFTNEPKPKVPLETLWPEGAETLRKIAEIADEGNKQMLLAFMEVFLAQSEGKRKKLKM